MELIDVNINGNDVRVQKDKGITQDINALKASAKELESQFAQVKKAQSDLEQRRRDRNFVAKSGNALQIFASNFNEFLDAYSGIYGIAQAADNQYGGLATQTLSLLLIVAKNKQGREVAISNALGDLTPWLSRLEKYREAYQHSEEMAGLIGKVHKAIKQFSEESCRYFNRKPIVRFWEAIVKPPNLGVDKTVNDIKEAIFQVTAEGLAQFISHYEAKARQGVADNWTIVRKLVGLPKEQVEEKIISAACESLYADAFKYPEKRLGRTLQEADIELLRKENLFDRWNDEPGCSTLLLTGHNFDQFGNGVGMCWLSSAALVIKKNVIGQGQILFYSGCRNEDSKRSFAREPFSNILSSFVCQIVQWDENFFEKSFKQVQQEVEDPAWTSPSAEARHQVQSDLLISLLNSWTMSTRVYLIIDRLDKFGGESDDNLYDLIREILRIISNTTLEVKLLIIADSLIWGDDDKQAMSQWKDWRGDPDLKWDKISSLHLRTRWHQPEIHAV